MGGRTRALAAPATVSRCGGHQNGSAQMLYEQFLTEVFRNLPT
jgi:hypothetical protein